MGALNGAGGRNRCMCQRLRQAHRSQSDASGHIWHEEASFIGWQPRQNRQASREYLNPSLATSFRFLGKDGVRHFVGGRLHVSNPWAWILRRMTSSGHVDASIHVQFL